MMMEGSGSGTRSGSIPETKDPEPGCPKTCGSGGTGFLFGSGNTFFMQIYITACK
jgi:hypothetical protein